MIKDPEDCVTMTEVRAGVDEVDAALVRLLDRRFGYMAAAARIKADRAMVRDEARKAQVIENVSRLASETELPPGLAPALWEVLVETSIGYELALFDERSGRAA
jgi:isochorismate pyruvate lyase